MKRKKITLLIVASSLIILGGCSSDKEKVAESYQQDKKILNTYDEDLLEPEIAQEKTNDQIIEELVKKELDVETTIEYKKLGVSVVESSTPFYTKIITDNKPLLNSPNLDSKIIDIVNKNEEKEKLTKLDKEYRDTLNNIFIKNVEKVTNKDDKQTQKEYEKELKAIYEKEVQEAQNNVGKKIDKTDTYEGSESDKED